MYILSLEVINKCNLNCTYCYLGEKKNTYMSMETAKKALDIAVHEAQKQYDKTLIVYFIGGEPLMAFETIQNIVSYVRSRCEESGLKHIFSTTINGTLLTNDITDFFIRNQFEVKLSLDGIEQSHDLNRKDYAGNGSFKKIMQNLSYLKRYESETGNKVSYAHVVTKNNYHFFSENFQFLLSLGCEKIETGVDHYCTWTKIEMEGLMEQLTEVFYLYKRHIQEKQKWFYWNMFEQNLEAFLLPCDFYSCKAGLNNVFVTTDGGIYTCIELPEFLIGNVQTGLNVPRIREIVYAKDEMARQCKVCKYVRNCKTRGCVASNFEMHHDIYQPVEINCIVTKKMYELIEKNITENQLNNMREEYYRRRSYGEK